MALVAGVDSSTQSTKVQLRDLDSGAVVGQASAAHPPTTPPRSEQDPTAWWAAFEKAWAELGRPTVEAISVAGQQHGMVALDVERRVLRPAKLWNDTESAPDAGWLIKQLPDGAAGWATAVGSVPVAAMTASKLSWLHRSEPQVWERLGHVLLPHDWMTLQLCGELVTDRGDASGTGYWSPAEHRYRWDLLGVIDSDRDWSAVVPRVAEPGEVVGRWGGAVVACGTGDNMAASLGVAQRPGTAVISVGTSGVISAVSTVAVADPSGAVAGFADATGAFLPLVCTLNAAKVLDAFARLLGVDHNQLTDLALEAPPGGPVVLPYFDGERTPNRPTASGWVSGLRSDVSRPQLARAAVEGVACGLLDGLDALSATVDIDRVVLTGGGARSTALVGVIAALAGVPVIRSAETEAVAAGACVQAAACVTGASHGQVAAEWGLGQTSDVAPLDVSDDLRERYAALRDVAIG